MKNKKIANATPLRYNGIDFKSKTEVMVYKTLREFGIRPKYEKIKFILWEGFYPKVPFYDKNKNTHLLELKTKKTENITYTPDFTFHYNRVLVIIEAKGFENDVYPVKKKMFRKVLEQRKGKTIFFEVYSKRQTVQAMKILKENYGPRKEKI